MLRRILLLAALALACCQEPPEEAQAPDNPGASEATPTWTTPAPAPPDERPAPTPEAPPTLPAAPLPAGLRDVGVFGDLDPQVAIALPPWLPRADPTLVVDAPHRTATLVLAGAPAKTYPLSDAVSALSFATLPLRPGDREELRALAPAVRRASAKDPWRDADDDGIPDPIDAALGARKAALNGADYMEGYEALAYPGGDVPRERGVCTDVIVRALRNAGLDLQVKLYEDMSARGARYGLKAGKRPDRSIEHRRVRRLLPWFRAHLAALPTTFDRDAKGRDAWLPGDVLFMDTIASRKGPDHVGIVSDRTDPLGRPLVINNWTYGFKTGDMPLLAFVPVTHRFRMGVGR